MIFFEDAGTKAVYSVGMHIFKSLGRTSLRDDPRLN